MTPNTHHIMKLIRLIPTMSLLLWIGLGQVQAQFDASIEVQEPSCNGYSDGIVTAMVEGGISPYTYLWSNGETSASIYGMTVGDFSVTITDANGDSSVASTSINEPESISAIIDLMATSNICDGSDLGLEVATSGGTAPYTYQWSTGTTEAVLTDIEPGVYTVTVTDVNDCIQTAIYIISEPFELVLTTLDVICANFCDGSAEAKISGGIAPYTYEWSNGGTSEVIDLLEAGEYSVTVTDGNGCVLEAIGEITEPEDMFLNVSVEGSCDDDALITAKANASGGTPPYNFTWSNGDIGEQTSNLVRGTTYFVTVTDANGCNMDREIAVPLEPGLVLFPTVQNAACDSGNGGSASVSADGGTEPYLYAWSNGGTGSSIGNLMAGTYTVTATDATGCKGIDSVTVNDGTALLLFTNMVNASCSGMNDGMANVLAEGGQGSYSYQWDDSENQTSPVAFNLTPGEYNVTVTDQEGCTGEASVMVGVNVTVDVDVTPTNPTCLESMDGSAIAAASGGTAPYGYQWTTGATTAMIANLVPNTYTVTVTDDNNCIAIQTINLEAETNLQPDITTEITDCNDENNIMVTLTGTANTDISSWDWMIDGEPETGQSVEVLIADGETLDIILSVATAEGCLDETMEELSINLFDAGISDMLGCVGDEVQFEANPDLEYVWTPADIFLSGQDTPNPVVDTENSIETTATVMITHAMGCTTTQMVDITITEEIMPDASAISTQQCEGTSVDFSHNIDGIAYMWDFGDGSESVMAQDTMHTYNEPGTYDVSLTPVSGQSCASGVEIQLVVMEAPEVDFMIDFEDCTDGSVSFVNMSNVPDDAEFLWEFSDNTTSTEENPTKTVDVSETVMATLTVSFGDNCVLMTQQEVDVNIPPTINLPETIPACANEDTSLNEDGDDTYNYIWNPVPNGGANDPNPLVMPSETTTYNVTVTNANEMCPVMDQVTVEVPEAIESDVLDDVNQCGDDLVSITANSPQAETYQWYSDAALTNPVGGNGATLEINPDGRNQMFYIRYTDEAGCPKDDSVSISNNAPRVELMTSSNLCAGNDIELTSTNIIENDELIYNWTPADMLDDNTSANPTAMPEETTTYMVTISNQFECELTDSLTINVIDLAADLQASASPDTILSGQSTNLMATENDYDYVWTTDNPGEINGADVFNPTTTPIVNTGGTEAVNVTYNVMITDENGCEANEVVEVRVLQSNCVEPFIFVPNAFTPNGDGINDILYVRGYSVTDVFFIIYNRWGEKVFETDKIDRGWDGRHKDEKICPDVYGYYLEVECFGGERFVKKGNVTVLK